MSATVLVVEDDALVRMVAVSLVEDLGYRVLEAAGPGEALALLRGGAAADVLFTDVRMPGMDGFALAARARALRPGIGVVYATGYADVGPAPGEEVEGPLLRKPYGPAELAQALAAAARA